MYLCKDYYVTSDRYNLILQKESIRGNGLPYRDNIAYFGDLHGLLKYMVDMELFLTGMISLAEIHLKLEELYDLIDGMYNMTAEEFHERIREDAVKTA